MRITYKKNRQLIDENKRKEDKINQLEGLLKVNKWKCCPYNLKYEISGEEQVVEQISYLFWEEISIYNAKF